jgi:tRNA nucleotidyltransferase/poly(A) polymerase
MTHAAEPLVLANTPTAVREVVRRLHEAGHPAFMVGPCVRSLLGGEGVRDFDVATSAPSELVLSTFGSAIPTGGGVVTLPTPDGPVDLTVFRGGSDIEDDLAHRDFTLHAMAYDPLHARLVDPYEGRTDIAKGLLRGVGALDARLAEDPLRALRAARLVATLGLEVDGAVERAMARVAKPLRRVTRTRLRHELTLLLLAPHASEGLALLRRTGLERALASDTDSDAAAIVGLLPFEIDLRLAGWLRGARAVGALRRLRFPRERVTRVERLLQLHPVDANFSPAQMQRRRLRRSGHELRQLLTLREAEIEVRGEGDEARTRLERLRAAIERVERTGLLEQHRTALALDGSAVMEHLGCGPGPRVGHALRHLALRVAADPTCNQPDALRALLDAWQRGRTPSPGTHDR